MTRRSTVYSCISVVMDPFMSAKIVSMTIFSECCTQNFFFTGESWAVFFFLARIHSGKPMFSPFVNILFFFFFFFFFTKTFFSMHIKYFSLNFKGWHFSTGKYLKIDQCSSLEPSVWFFAILNSLKTNIFVILKWF